MNHHGIKNSYHTYLLLAMLLLFLLGCQQEHATVGINSTVTPRVVMDPTSPGLNVGGTEQVLPTSTESVMSTDLAIIATEALHTSGKIAYLFIGGPSQNSINGKAIIVDLQTKISTDIELNCLFCNSLTWSPNGQALAYSGYPDLPGQTEIYIANTDNQQLRQITHDSTSKIDVTWSPDGNFLTYTNETDTADIVNLNIKTGSLLKLTSTPELESNPVWSPDGERIAFVYRPDWSASGELWIMQKDGRNREQVMDKPVAVSQVSWSPDGKQIAFSSPQECGDIYSVDVETHRVLKLTEFAGCASNPTWSPDRKSIAFIVIYDPPNSKTGIRWEIYVMDALGKEKSLVKSGSKGGPMFLSWCPVPSLQVGQTYKITELGANLHLRESPSSESNVIETLDQGNSIKTLGGPVQADGYYWWSVSTDNGLQGWIADVSGWYSHND